MTYLTRTLIFSLANLVAFYWWNRQQRRRDERERIRTEHRAAAEWLFTVIRGGR